MKETNEAKSGRFPVFAERFSALRGSMTQRAFADKLGISVPTVGFYEHGDRLPDAATLERICRTCGVAADWLLGLTGDPHAKADAAAELGLSRRAVDRLRALAADAAGEDAGDAESAQEILALLSAVIVSAPAESASIWRDMRETAAVLRSAERDEAGAENARRRLAEARETAAKFGTALLSGGRAKDYYCRLLAEALSAALADYTGPWKE